MLKKIFVLLVGLFLVGSITMAQGIADNSSEPLAYINYVEGKVLFKDFQDVELNMILQAGDEINTQEGRVEILLKGGGVIRLDRNTRVVFAALTEKSIMLEIWSGNVYVHARGKIEIGIKTLHKSFNLTKRGLHLIEVRKNKTNDYFDPRPENDFDRWNEKREKGIRRSKGINSSNDHEYALYNYGSRRYYWSYWYWYGWYWCGPYWYYWSPIWHNYHYYYHDRYQYYNSYGQYRPRYTQRTVIHKNQLKKRTFQNTANRPTIQNKVTSVKTTHKIYLPDSGMSVQKRTIALSPKLYHSRINTQFRPSPKKLIRSFLSPSRSFSRFSPVRRFLAKSPTLHRSIQKKIRKK